MRGVSASVNLCSIWFCLTTSACLEASLTGMSRLIFAGWVTISAVYSCFPFCVRMCEFVDHLHEHFASPVVIRNAHYVPPKVQLNICRRKKDFLFLFLALVQVLLCISVFRIRDILVRCWSRRCSLTATLRGTCGRQTQANEDWKDDSISLLWRHLVVENNIFVNVKFPQKFLGCYGREERNFSDCIQGPLDGRQKIYFFNS